MWPLVSALLLLASPAPLTVALGVTDLLDPPACTVGYQRFGEEPVSLGYQWSGYDSASGIYFVPETPAGDRRPVFMHVPWVPVTGQTFADFALMLPRTTRIRLAVSTMIRPEAKGSDGVTWRVRVGQQVVWEHNGNHRAWRDFDVDLSAYAGQTITLRLEVDPGPARNSSDDWSLWGNARLTCGTAAEVAVAEQEATTRRAAQQRAELAAAGRLATADLRAFSSGEARTVRPSTAGPVANQITADGSRYTLSCRADGRRVEYRFDPAQGLLAGLEVRVDGQPLQPQPYAGGPRVLLAGRPRLPGSPGLSCQLLEAAVVQGRLRCRWEYRAAGVARPATLTAQLWCEGWSLGLALDGSADFDGFAPQVQGGEQVPCTFAPGGPVRRHPQGVFCAALPDLWQSNCSGVGGAQSQTHYEHLTDGTRRPLRDLFWFTVAPRYEEALPNIPHAPSPYLADLAQRCVLDGWGGNFADDEAWVRAMSRYGVDRLLFIKHVWQRDGYDQTYPNVFPANAAQGGDAALARLTRAAQAAGHRFCVHENFYDYYPNAEDFHPEHCALDPNGRQPDGWNNGKFIAKLLKPSLLMDYARRFTPEVRRRYGCDAAYHDIMPTWLVDFDARVGEAGMIAVTHHHSRELFDFDRRVYGGPVVCEAADPVTAGLYDGGCNHGVDTWQTPRTVAYELLKVHPKMSNHGFGYYERWLPWGYGPGWYDYLMTDRELDAYRSVQIAFGRTGFLGHQLMPHPHPFVREYHLMQAFGRAYTGQPVRQIAWQVTVGDQTGWVDSATATRWGKLDRLRVIYERGQTVWVNLGREPWTIDGVTLPAGGSLTRGPRAAARTAVINGQIADYAAYDGVVFADARSHVYQPPKQADPITPRVAHFRDLGDGQFEVSVAWDCQRRLDRDYNCFWHFVDAQGIRFQSDHAPKQPTSSWSVGAAVVDGPHRLRVPAEQRTETYGFAVGLYTLQAGRVKLVNNADTVQLGLLHVTRADGRVTGVRFEPTTGSTQPGSAPEPYLEGANTARRVIDFGELATNGALVLRQVDGGRELVPVPIGTPMQVRLRAPVAAADACGPDGRSPLGSLTVQREGGWTRFELPAGVGLVRLR